MTVAQSQNNVHDEKYIIHVNVLLDHTQQVVQQTTLHTFRQTSHTNQPHP